jgi:hypothetical protein
MEHSLPPTVKKRVTAWTDPDTVTLQVEAGTSLDDLIRISFEVQRKALQMAQEMELKKNFR